jgi:membrane associated rhomboid family serine protease
MQERIDRFVEGWSRHGSASGVPVELVVVAITDGPYALSEIRRISRLRPSTFHADLRPTTWVADLSSRRVIAGWSPRAREGLEELNRAVQGELAAQADEHDLQEKGRMSVQQAAAFQSLMRGRQPRITYALIALNVAIYIAVGLRAGTLFPSDSDQPFEAALKSFGALSTSLVEQGQWWRLMASMFLHANLTHLAVNMISLMYLGLIAERLYGSAKFTVIYMGAGLAGNVASVLYNSSTQIHVGPLAVTGGDPGALAVGASGAIFGIAGALFTLRYQRSELIPRAIRTRVSSSILMMVVINFAVLHFVPQVDNSAHLGGLVGGAILSLVLPISGHIEKDVVSSYQPGQPTGTERG